MIFVQIASYRDSELLPTIMNCIATAKYKNDISFGICWQRDRGDNSLSALRSYSNFRIDEVDWEVSEGLAWARSRAQALYNGEDYTLQLDSHHRFANGWDEHLINATEMTGSAKPLISSYAATYNRHASYQLSDQPFNIVAKRFVDSISMALAAHPIEEWEALERPTRARFASDHFMFTLGKHCTECLYDPHLYFSGREIALTLRSFSQGYDLFHPHRNWVWHEYTCCDRPQHWKDHSQIVEGLPAWEHLAFSARQRLSMLLLRNNDKLGLASFDLGNVRSLREYELYAGIDFKKGRLQLETLTGVEPPCFYRSEELWENSFSTKDEVELKWNIFDIRQRSDIDLIRFDIEDVDGQVIYRYDAEADSPEVQFAVDSRPVSLEIGARPARILVWPHSRSDGWLVQRAYPIA